MESQFLLSGKKEELEIMQLSIGGKVNERESLIDSFGITVDHKVLF